LPSIKEDAIRPVEEPFTGRIIHCQRKSFTIVSTLETLETGVFILAARIMKKDRSIPPTANCESVLLTPPLGNEIPHRKPLQRTQINLSIKPLILHILLMLTAKPFVPSSAP